MESVGPYLKQVRESKGFTLDHVASVTRIQRKTLEALEEEQFALLPQPVFIKGFLRTYARALGIDEEDVLRRFAEASSQFYAQQEVEQQRARLQHEETQREKRRRSLIIGIAVSMILSLVLLLPKLHKTSTPSSPTSTPSPSAKARVDSAREKRDSSALSSTKHDTASTAQVPTSSSATRSGRAAALPDTESPSRQPIRTNPSIPRTSAPAAAYPQRLQLEAKEMTWIVVQADDGKPQEALLKPGERVTWTAQKRFTLTLGNAGGVTVTFNGKVLKPFGRPGVVVRDIVIPAE